MKSTNVAALTIVLFAVGLCAANAASMPTLIESFGAPGAASQLRYSEQYNLLFMRNSGSAIRVVDVATKSQIDLRLANQQFTDMDLTPDGKYLYAADWGRVQMGYGTPINQHYVHRYNLASRQWEAKTSSVDTYRLEAVDADRIILLESDQWVSVHLEQWGVGGGMTHISSAGSDFYGDIEYDTTTGRVYHGNSGLSSAEINVLRLVGNAFTYGVGSGTYGSAQYGGGSSVLSLDGNRFYYGPLQVEALDVTNNIRMFPEVIHAATAELALGANQVYDANAGTPLGSLGYSTSVYGLSDSGRHLWAYSNNSLYHYSLVPEPSTCLLLVAGSVLLGQAGRPCRRRARGGGF